MPHPDLDIATGTAMTRPSSPEADRLLAIHGADPTRWPSEARELADTCDLDERAAQARLDDWLATSTPPQPPMALRVAILARTRAMSPRVGLREALLGFWQEIGGLRIAAPAFALALAVGIGLGNGLIPETTTLEDATDDLLTLALIDDDYLALAP